MSYQELDFIADVYIPILFMISLLVLSRAAVCQGVKSQVSQWLNLFSSIATVYMVKAADDYYQLWPLLGLDYSTHTALALVFVVFLSSKSLTFLMLSVTSMLLYIALMMYQNYHTFYDVMATSLVVLPLFFVLSRLFTKLLTHDLLSEKH